MRTHPHTLKDNAPLTSHHSVLALHPPASWASFLFLKYTEPLATSLCHLLGLPQPGLLSFNSACSWRSSSCRVQLTCDLLTQALPEPLL